MTCVTTILLPPVIQQFSRSIKRAKKTQKCTKSFLMDIMEAKSTNSLSKNNIITLSSLLLGVMKIDDRRNSKCRFWHRRKVFERFIRLIQGLNLPRGSMKAMDGAEQSRRGSMEAICGLLAINQLLADWPSQASGRPVGGVYGTYKNSNLNQSRRRTLWE